MVGISRSLRRELFRTGSGLLSTSLARLGEILAEELNTRGAQREEQASVIEKICERQLEEGLEQQENQHCKTKETFS